jgi:hypothetical protein
MRTEGQAHGSSQLLRHPPGLLNLDACADVQCHPAGVLAGEGDLVWHQHHHFAVRACNLPPAPSGHTPSDAARRDGSYRRGCQRVNAAPIGIVSLGRLTARPRRLRHAVSVIA